MARVFFALHAAGVDDDLLLPAAGQAAAPASFPLVSQLTTLGQLGQDITVQAASDSVDDLHRTATTFVQQRLGSDWSIAARTEALTLSSRWNPLKAVWLPIGGGDVVVGWTLSHQGAAVLATSEGHTSTGGDPSTAQLTAVLGIQTPP